ncbi:MAG: hypothetical protein C0412_13190, partial [Flavobacterium sp.]|nr:hypothetical protein [Flavobacterium sp.]
MASLYRKKCFLFISGSCDLDDYEYTILNAAHFLNVTANMKVIIFDFHNDLTKIASNHRFLPLNDLIVQYKNTHQIEDPFKSHTQSERKEKITIYRGDISKEPVLSGIE